MTKRLLIVEADFAETRLDKVLQAHEKLGFAQVQKLCRMGHIRLNGKRVKGNERVAEGDEITLPPASLNIPHSTPSTHLSPADVAFLKSLVVYEDDDIVALNKPAGLPVQAGTGHEKSLDRMVKALYAPKPAPKLIHRLDRDTSGVLLFGKTRTAAARMAKQFQGDEIEKTYWAITSGKKLPDKDRVDAPLSKGGEDIEKVSVDPNGQPARTNFRVRGRKAGLQWLEVKPKTGRTHQIRVHMAYIGAPLCGDMKYGKKDDTPYGIKGLFLHARSLTIKHPSLPSRITFTADVPAHFESLAIKTGFSFTE